MESCPQLSFRDLCRLPGGRADSVPDQTRGTVVLALAANIGVAVIKLAAGLFTGSAAMLSEAAHSVADTMNEVFLLVSLRRPERPADRTHPFGYGKDRFFYALLAAMGIFLSGTAFSAYQGVSALLASGTAKQPSLLDFVVSYVVLGVSLLLEGASLRKAATQVRQEARHANRSFFIFVLRSPDPTVKTVAGEDSVAVIGVLTAAAGTALHQLTGSEVTTGDLDRTLQSERQTLDDIDQLNGPGGVAGLRLPRSRSARRISSSGA